MSVPAYKININIRVFVSHSVGSNLTLCDPPGLKPASQAPRSMDFYRQEYRSG